MHVAHHHHHSVCMDNHPSERSSPWREELEANVAQNRLVSAHDHRARSSCLERVVGQVWELGSRDESHAEVARQVAIP